MNETEALVLRGLAKQLHELSNSVFDTPPIKLMQKLTTMAASLSIFVDEHEESQ